MENKDLLKSKFIQATNSTIFKINYSPKYMLSNSRTFLHILKKMQFS